MSRRKKPRLDNPREVELEERTTIETDATTVLNRDAASDQRPVQRGLDHITKETDTAALMRAAKARRMVTGQREAPMTQVGREGVMDSPRREPSTGSGSSSTQRRSGSDDGEQDLYDLLSSSQKAEVNEAIHRIDEILKGDPKLRRGEVESMARQLVVSMHDLGHSLDQTLALVTSIWKINASNWSVERRKADEKRRNDRLNSLLG